MNTDHPVAARYLQSFEAALARFDFAERRDVVEEIRSHISEAHAAGKPVEGVLAALGPADALARAYAVELTLNRRGEKELRTLGAATRIVGIVTASGVATLLVVMALGSLGFAFVGSGVVVFVIGALEAAGVHLPAVRLNGMHPVAVMAFGPPFLTVGLFALWSLWRYLRFMARTLRTALPRAQSA